jgi:hypothetical protein
MLPMSKDTEDLLAHQRILVLGKLLNFGQEVASITSFNSPESLN